MTRVLAVVGAALLIAVAVLVRGFLDDDDGATADDGGDEPADLVVACIPELEDACERLDVDELRIEHPDATIAAPDDVDAWVTLDPWPEIAGQTASGPLTDVGTPLAQTDLPLLLRTEAIGTCADWACAGDSGRAALPLTSTASGLLALGHASFEWTAVARPGEPFAGQELSLPEFQRWLGAIDFTRDPVDDMLVLGNAGPDATAVTSAAYDTDVRSSPRADGLATAPGAVPATLVAVVTGPAADSIGEPLQRALVAAGWRPAQPDARSGGLPSAGVLFALAQEVS